MTETKLQQVYTYLRDKVKVRKITNLDHWQLSLSFAGNCWQTRTGYPSFTKKHLVDVELFVTECAKTIIKDPVLSILIEKFL